MSSTKARPKKIIDAQLSMEGYCACGRKEGGFKMDKKFCSRYCSIFMTRPAEGFKKKTMYEAWRGSSKHSYNPHYPKLDISCAWCNQSFTISRNIKEANRYFCKDHCVRQAGRSALRSKKRLGSKKVGDRVRIMRVLREFPNQPLTSQEVAFYWTKWFGNTSCTAHKSANLINILIPKGMIERIQIGKETATYLSLKNNESLKSLFGEENLNG